MKLSPNLSQNLCLNPTLNPKCLLNRTPGQVPLQRRGDVRRLLPHHVPHCQLSGVVLLSTLKDNFQRLLECEDSAIRRDALVKPSQLRLTGKW